MESLRQIFKRSPREALDKVFEAEKRLCVSCPHTVLLFQCYVDENGQRRGGFRYISKDELLSRPHKIEFLGENISILWTDKLSNK